MTSAAQATDMTRAMAKALESVHEPKVEALFTRYSVNKNFVTCPAVEIPQPAAVQTNCAACEGRGHEHDCPECTCECDICGSTGKVEKIVDCSVSLGEVIVAGRYLRMIQELPGAQIALDDEASLAPIPFRFDGGIGILMPMLAQRKTHIVAELKSSEAA